MGVRFNKRIKLAKGINLNLSKSGIGISAGTKGARVGIGPRGVRTSVGAPGTGVRFEQQHSLNASKKEKRQKAPRSVVVEVPAKAGIIVNGRSVHQETVRVPIKVTRKDVKRYEKLQRKASRRGCGCFTMMIGSALSLVAILLLLFI